MEILTVNNVSKLIKKKSILKDINLTLHDNEVLALIGPNGAGKTTSIKAILNLININGGEIIFNGKNIKDSNEYLREISFVLQIPSVNPKITIKNYIEEHFISLEISQIPNFEDIIKSMELNVSIETKLSELSLGMYQRLILSLALATNPKLIIFDEPFIGLDIDGVRFLKDTIKNLKKKNIGVLITSHNLLDLAQVADSIIFMIEGKTFDKKEINYILSNYPGGLEQYYNEIKGEKNE